jgi:hexosaminidase
MIKVIPAPRNVAFDIGQLRVRPGARVEYTEEALAPIVDRFRQDVACRTGLRLEALQTARGAPTGHPSIRIELGDGTDLDALPTPIGVSPMGEISHNERYSLTIGADRIVVRGIEAVGAARGLTTLVQLLATTPPGADGAVVLPAMHILDAPRFAWRGLHFDVVRTFFTVHEVKRVIDLLALYKFNALSIHLTDDQAWRIEAGRPAGYKSDAPFYTNAELRELIRYAEERFIALIPLVNTPGHANALVQMRPELKSGRNMLEFDLESPPGKKHRSAWLDPELPATYKAVEAVLAEIAGVFPGPYIFIGADEPFGMPDELYGSFVRHVHAFVRSIGKRTLGFQESMRSGIDRDHIIMYWISISDPEDSSLQLPAHFAAMIKKNIARSPKDVERALKFSIPILLSPLSHAYFDVPYAEPSADPDQEERGLRVGLRAYAPKTIAETFDWDPAEALGLNARLANLAGVGAAIWAETIKDFTDLTFMLLPRLAGTAQKGWSAARVPSWTDHRACLAAHGRLWTHDGLTYFKSSTVDWAPDTSHK